MLKQQKLASQQGRPLLIPPNKLLLRNVLASADRLQFARGNIFANAIGPTNQSTDSLVEGDRIEDTP